MNSDPFTAYILERQPATLADALTLFDERTKGPDASSPHVVSHDWLKKHLCWNEQRRKLLNNFENFIREANQQGILVEAVLLGGSYVSTKNDPKDMDFLVVYRAMPNFEPESLTRFVSLKRAGLDWRFIPSDAGIIPLLKISIFCHILYEGRNGGEGSLLIVFDQVS